MDARHHQSLIEGAHMRCPRCQELFPLLAWRPLQEIEAYAKETTPIYKCRRSQVSVSGKKGCGFLFAPVDYTPTRAYGTDINGIDLGAFIEKEPV